MRPHNEAVERSVVTAPGVAASAARMFFGDVDVCFFDVTWRQSFNEQGQAMLTDFAHGGSGSSLLEQHFQYCFPC